MSSQPGTVHTETIGHVLKIEIDNAEKMNALTPAIVVGLSDALSELDSNDTLRAGVVCARGDHFTAGLNMPDFFGPDATFKGLEPGKIDPFGLSNICSKPIITAVQGITYTAGIEIALAGDIIIAADSTKFSQLEPKRGVAAVGGAHFRYLMRAGWGDVMYHLLLCDEFGANEAKRIGLVQEVVPDGQQVQRALELATRISLNSPIATQITKRACRTFTMLGEKAAIEHLPDMIETMTNTDDMKEGIASFKERRPAVFTGKRSREEDR